MQAAIFAILLMSSVSAEAMEFGDRPGLVAEHRSPVVRHKTASTDRVRRQVDDLVRFKIGGSMLAERQRPVSMVIHTPLDSLMRDRPGRLSPEFTAVSESSHIRLDSRHSASIPRKPAVMIVGMRFEDRPGASSVGFANITTASIEGYPGPHPRVRLQIQGSTVLAFRGR